MGSTSEQKQVVLITGASSGFGKLATEQLLEEGCVVYPAARRLEQMQDLAEKGAHPLRMDVTEDASVAAGVKQVVDEQGRIDALVNNAGYAAYGMVECVDMSLAQRQFEVNVFGAARLIQAVLPQMRRQGSGRIVNISSVVGKVSAPLLGWYAASKHAVEALSDALRPEVESFGIQVSVIEPGAFRTGFEGVALDQLDAVEHDEAYATSVSNFKENFVKTYEKAPTPEPVVEAIIKAVSARKPKIRYPVGDARLAFMMKGLLGDKAFSKIMKKQLGVE